jgi:hypothetical protein
MVYLHLELRELAVVKRPEPILFGKRGVKF